MCYYKCAFCIFWQWTSLKVLSISWESSLSLQLFFFSTLLSFLDDFPCNMHSQFYFLSLGLWLAPQKALWLKNTKWEVVFSGFVNLLFSFNIHYIFRYLFFLNFEYFKLFFKNSLKNSSAFYISVHTNLDSRKHYGSSKHFENWF